MRRLAVLSGVMGMMVIGTAAFANSPYGLWTRPSNGTQVNFYNCGGKLCAKVVKSQTKANEGKVIMSGAEKSSANTWKGNLLNLDNGQTYTGVVTLEGPKALKLQGCVLGGMICTGETWVK